MGANQFIFLPKNEIKSVSEHIRELRGKLIISLIAVFSGAAIAHFFHEKIINFLLAPAGGQQLIFLSPLEPLFFIFKIDIIAGIIFAIPVIVWGIISYLAPALPKKIYKLIFFIYFTSIILTIFGLLYAFLVTIPISLKFLFSIVVPGIQNQISAQNYIDFFIAQTLIVTGIFQIPILIIGGIQVNAFKTKTLAAKRSYIYFISIIALAIITPTTDVFSLIVIFIPCLVIFEASLISGYLIESIKKKNKGANLN